MSITGIARAGEVIRTTQFAFHSNLKTNLNDALIAAASAQTKAKAGPFDIGEEQACFEGLAPSAAAAWKVAVDFYAQVFPPFQWRDRQSFLIRLALAVEEPDLDPAEQQFVGIVQGMLDAATPAYENCLWKQQDRKNRAWISHVAQDLANHESAIAPRLSALYQTPWHGLPLRVDVVPYAPSRGANSIILSPAGGHILVSSSVPAHLSLEIVFHEASHTVAAAWRDDPLPKVLEQAARELGTSLPPDLWHVVLFYFTGQTVRSVLAAAGVADYTPYMDERKLWNGRWGRFRDAIETTAPPYLDGEIDLPTLAKQLLQHIAQSES